MYGTSGSFFKDRVKCGMVKSCVCANRMSKCKWFYSPYSCDPTGLVGCERDTECDFDFVEALLLISIIKLIEKIFYFISFNIHFLANRSGQYSVGHSVLNIHALVKKTT